MQTRKTLSLFLAFSDLIEYYVKVKNKFCGDSFLSICARCRTGVIIKMFYCLLIFSILMALFCHDKFCQSIQTINSAMLLAGPYGVSILISLLSLKMLQGRGREEAAVSFQSIENLFKYGIVALFLAVIFPLLVAFIRDLFANRKGEKEL